MAVDMYIHQGDTLPAAQAVLTDGTGAVVNLTTALGVRFVLRGIGAGTPAVDAVGTIVAPPTDGTVRYDWQVADTEAADVGAYFGEFIVTFGTGAQTFPNPDPLVIVIVPSVAGVPTISPADLAAIRSRIGSASPPTDADLAISLARLGTVDAVALEVLQGRYADLLAEPAKWSVEGDFSIDNTATIKALAAQIGTLQPVVEPEPSTITVGYFTRADRCGR